MPDAPMPERGPLGAAVAVVACLLSPSALAQDSAADRLADVESRLAETRQEAARLGEDVDALTLEMNALERELVARAAEVQRHEASLTAIETELAGLEAKEAERSAALAARRDGMATILAALVRVARRPPEALLVMPGTLGDVRHAGIVLAALVPGIEAEARALGRELEALAGLRADLDAQRTARAAASAKLEDARRRTLALLAETTALRGRRQEDQEAAETRALKLAAEAEDLRALVLALGAEGDGAAVDPGADQENEVALAQAVKLPPKPVTPPPRSAGSQGSTGAAEIVPVAVPAATAGLSLLVPAAGTVVRGFGEANAEGIAARGMVIATRARGQVVAPADGQVVFAGTYRNLGQLLIIAHGREYHSVLAGFARIDARVGQHLVAGEPVGVMGAEGTSGTTLYFELRRAGEPVDPAPALRTAFSEDGG
ncbi:MAG: murein hydrolase activator EnvC family protein [Alphaproteobacteria bacterium]